MLLPPVCRCGHQLTTTKIQTWIYQVENKLATWPEIFANHPEFPHCCRVFIMSVKSPDDMIQRRSAFRDQVNENKERGGWLGMMDSKQWKTMIAQSSVSNAIENSVKSSSVASYVESIKRSNSAPVRSRTRRPRKSKNDEDVMMKDSTHDGENEQEQIANQTRTKARIDTLLSASRSSSVRQRMLTRPLSVVSRPPIYNDRQHLAGPPTQPLIIGSSLSQVVSLSENTFLHPEFKTRHFHRSRSSSLPCITTFVPHPTLLVMKGSIKHPLLLPVINKEPSHVSKHDETQVSYMSDEQTLIWKGDVNASQLLWSLVKNENVIQDKLTIVLDKNAYDRNSIIDPNWILRVWRKIPNRICYIRQSTSDRPSSISEHPNLFDQSSFEYNTQHHEKTHCYLSPTETLLVAWSTESFWDPSCQIEFEFVNSSQLVSYLQPDIDVELVQYWLQQHTGLSENNNQIEPKDVLYSKPAVQAHLEHMLLSSTFSHPWRVSANRLFSFISILQTNKGS